MIFKGSRVALATCSGESPIASKRWAVSVLASILPSLFAVSMEWRPGGFAIRRRKRFDLLKTGGFAIPQQKEKHTSLLRIANPQSLNR